ncbi:MULTISPECIES: cation-transporting P-type ATPase [unclassified Bacillus (in: firmicutes)]|uniref:P-type ATPase n=1 Tax=unclassified Bacillus (in: firmicutes) TaxID=185979 RepID=UPI0008EF6865|nr:MULTISPECIES: cation-transporting P-type ATPase [unclassified Bacillus (in: firmicutes)]SFI11720.1 Cation transporter/ATPase, N-terminus [Bacillus sp. 71mf]SFS75704.1 Cation transporter/ATPase, N-terminus [Bacillus sp. 103mf]
MLYVNKREGIINNITHKKTIKVQEILQKNNEMLMEVAIRDVKSVYAYFKTTRNGLSVKEAKRRIVQYGKNERYVNKKVMLTHIMMKLMEKVNLFEKEANQTNATISKTVTVLRVVNDKVNGIDTDSEMMNIPIEELVPGDVICLSAGDTVPADARIIYAKDVLVDESLLTGKEMLVEKYESCYHIEKKRFMPLKRIKDYNPLCLENLCYQGTHIISGTAKAVVVSTGNNTYVELLHQCCK